MEIVVNTRLLLPNRLEGIGRFAFESLKRITRDHPEHHFVFLFDRDFDEQFVFSDNITPISLFPQARHPFLYYWWFEYSVASILKDLKPDLFLSPDGYLSLSSKVKQLPVIHDLNFVHYPKDLPFLTSKYYNYFFPKFARKATRIATVSEYSKADIHKTFGVDTALIDVVYNGSSDVFVPLDEKQKLETKKQFSKGSAYFLFVGSLHPRKNIARLFQAFDAFKASVSSDVKLLIVGEKFWWNNDLKSAFENMKFNNDVVFTGRLSSQDLARVLASALALTYVPYFEGFGIPIVEAFSCGTPVITSNITSMPEVGGDAVLLVDPFSVESIRDAMLLAYKDEPLCKQLALKGFERVKNFSWNKTAELLWGSVEQAVAS